MNNDFDTAVAIATAINADPTLKTIGVHAELLTDETKGTEVRIGLHKIRIGQVRWYDGWYAEQRGAISKQVGLRWSLDLTTDARDYVPAMVGAAAGEAFTMLTAIAKAQAQHAFNKAMATAHAAGAVAEG